MAKKPYRDPKTTKIEDWKWRALEPIKAQLAMREIPDYIQKGFGGFMNEQAGRAQRGQMTPRDLIKAYTIAQSSIGRGGLSHATATKMGMKLPNTGGEVRPEGAFAEWLGSPQGQRYLDLAEQGHIDPAAIADLQYKFAPFGKQNDQATKMAEAARTMPGMSAQLNAALTGTPDEYRDFAEQLKGIAGAKSGFIGSLLGRGDLPTLDARQLNLHTEGAPVGVGAIMARGKGKGAREAVDRLAARQRAMELDIDPALAAHYQHLAHHAVWDKTAGAKTTHEDLIRAMRGYDEGGSVEPTIAQMKQALAKPKPTKASEALGKHEGKTLMVTQADRTKVGGGYLGGPGFSSLQHTDPAYEGKVWGVMTPGMASTILGANRRVPEGEAIWSTLIGTPEQHTSNQMVFDKLVKDFKKAAKAGLLTPELRDKINARLSAIADKEGKPFFGVGADIRDPALIKAADTFAKRKIIADLIGGHGVGGKKGQIGNYDKLLRSTTEPDLLSVPTHSIGPRLFGLSGETSNRPDLHPAFPQLLHGEDFGQAYHPVPKELMLRDYMAQFQAEKNRKPGYFDLTLGYPPMQHLSEEFLTHLQKQGHAEGGSIGPTLDEMRAALVMHKADGGVIDIKEVGAEEAPDMPVKEYMKPTGKGFPVGGVDFQPQSPGQQMLPMPPQPPGMPGQPPAPGQPPQGAMPPGAPPMGAMPPGAPPQAPAAPPKGPQSNILAMTPQGQAMQAMRPNPVPMPRPPMMPMGRPPMARMAKGGSTHDIHLEERAL